MYRFELDAPHRTSDVAAIRYFAVGNSVARTVGELADWRFGGLSRVGGFLASGSRNRTCRKNSSVVDLLKGSCSCRDWLWEFQFGMNSTSAR